MSLPPGCSSATASASENPAFARIRAHSISNRLRSASDLCDDGAISNAEKGALRHMIISDDARLTEALQRFEHGDLSLLKNLIESGELQNLTKMAGDDGELDINFLAGNSAGSRAAGGGGERGGSSSDDVLGWGDLPFDTIYDNIKANTSVGAGGDAGGGNTAQSPPARSGRKGKGAAANCGKLPFRMSQADGGFGLSEDGRKYSFEITGNGGRKYSFEVVSTAAGRKFSFDLGGKGGQRSSIAPRLGARGVVVSVAAAAAAAAAVAGESAGSKRKLSLGYGPNLGATATMMTKNQEEEGVDVDVDVMSTNGDGAGDADAATAVVKGGTKRHPNDFDIPAPIPSPEASPVGNKGKRRKNFVPPAVRAAHAGLGGGGTVRAVTMIGAYSPDARKRRIDRFRVKRVKRLQNMKTEGNENA